MKTHPSRLRLAFALASLAIVAVAAGSPAFAGKYSEEEESNQLAEPKEGHATIYLVRGTSMGAAIYFWTFADSQFLGVTRGKGYTWSYVKPGSYTVWSHAENVSAITLEVEAGKTYYIRQVVLPGFGKARVRTELIDEQEFSKLMKKAKKKSTATEEGLQKALEIADEHLELAREKAAKKEQD